MAADYDLPSVVEKRVRFFDGQFLQDQDFVDEQKYHLDRERRHNRLLHVAGIADGLTVAAGAPNTVTVTAGTAVDGDGRQLVLAKDTTVDLPARYNNRQGIELYLGYEESGQDRQAEAGIEDYSRWLERPRLEALAPGETYTGTTPPVLLARLALDASGRVTVDGSARQYAGVRLPGSAADAPTLRTAADGRVGLAGSLSVTGRMRVEQGVIQRGGTAITSTEDLGLYSQIDGQWIRVVSTNAPMRFFTDGGIGTTARLTVEADGDVGIGTTDPKAKLEVAGGGGQTVDLLVNGRIRSNNNDGGLWVAENRLVGGHSTDKIGLYNNGEWRLTVANDGKVGIGTQNPSALLSVAPSGTDLGGSAHSTVWRTSAGTLADADKSELALGSIGFTNSKDRPHTISLGVRAVRTAAAGDWTTTSIGLGMDVDNTVRAGASLYLHANKNVGIGTNKPTARLSVVQAGATELAGTAHSTAWRTSAGSLGGTANNELALGSFGFTTSTTTGTTTTTNSVGLGVRAIRAATGTDWTTTAIRLGMDVDNTVRAGASLSLHAGGSVGIGTTDPKAKLEVAGGGGQTVDLLVNGRIRSNNNDGGLWVAENRLVGGHSTDKIGLYNNGEWRLTVANDGKVGVGTNTPAARLSVVQSGTAELSGTAHSTVLRASAGELGEAAASELALGSIGFATPIWALTFTRPTTTSTWSGGTTISLSVPDTPTAVWTKTANTNHVSLGVRAIRTTQAGDWKTTAIGLGMDVDNTVRAGASLSLAGNGNVGIGTNNPAGRLDVNGDIYKKGKKSITLVGISQAYNNMTTSGAWADEIKIGETSDTYLEVFAQAWSKTYSWGNSRIRFYYV